VTQIDAHLNGRDQLRNDHSVCWAAYEGFCGAVELEASTEARCAPHQGAAGAGVVQQSGGSKLEPACRVTGLARQNSFPWWASHIKTRRIADNLQPAQRCQRRLLLPPLDKLFDPSLESAFDSGVHCSVSMRRPASVALAGGSMVPNLNPAVQPRARRRSLQCPRDDLRHLRPMGSRGFGLVFGPIKVDPGWPRGV